MGINEAARRLGLSIKRVDQLSRDGSLAWIQLAGERGHRVYRAEDVEALRLRRLAAREAAVK